jgi:hypothetical protein
MLRCLRLLHHISEGVGVLSGDTRQHISIRPTTCLALIPAHVHMVEGPKAC